MARSTINAQHGLSNRLLILKRHLRTCDTCFGARKANDPHNLCDTGIRMVLECADKYDALIDLRVKARDPSINAIIPCPDPAKHGSAYSLIATPLIVSGEMQALF